MSLQTLRFTATPFLAIFFNVKQNSRMRHKEVHLVKQVLPKHWRSHWRFSVRKGVLRNFAKFLGKLLCQSLFLIKLQASHSFSIKLQTWGLQLFKKETVAQVFSCEFCEISKNTSLTQHLWVTASGNSHWHFFLKVTAFKIWR